MSEKEAEKIKKLVAFKKKLQRRVDELESELEEMQTMLQTVDVILLEKGFQRAEIAAPAMAETLPPKEETETKPPSPPTPMVEHEKVTPLKTFTGELLANLHINENSLRVVFAEDKNFNTNTPPFTQFLVERVLTKMKEKDEELVKTGKLTPDKIFSYDINLDGDTIREIAIKNINPNRFRELKSSIRWTLEKMYEKMKSQS